MSGVRKWYIGVYGGEAQARTCSPYPNEVIRDSWDREVQVATGFISGKGEFFDHVLKVPLHHNLMMVFRVGRRWKP